MDMIQHYEKRIITAFVGYSSGDAAKACLWKKVEGTSHWKPIGEDHKKPYHYRSLIIVKDRLTL